jgi:hypothetical protein
MLIANANARVHELAVEREVLNEKHHAPDRINLDLGLVTSLGGTKRPRSSPVTVGEGDFTADEEEPTEEERQTLRRSKGHMELYFRHLLTVPSRRVSAKGGMARCYRRVV